MGFRPLPMESHRYRHNSHSFGGALLLGSISLDGEFEVLGFHLSPSLVRVEGLYGLGSRWRHFAQILFVYLAVMTHDEGHDSRGPIFSWIGNQGETSNHVVLDHIVVCSTRRALPCAFRIL